jgi:multidrug efflux pump subunit AcrA (membrane-fusion protein)
MDKYEDLRKSISDLELQEQKLRAALNTLKEANLKDTEEWRIYSLFLETTIQTKQQVKDSIDFLIRDDKFMEDLKRKSEAQRIEAEQARREAEIEHQKALKLCEETKRRTARIRTATKREVPDGTIGSIVKTEWGTFFNIAQTPS